MHYFQHGGHILKDNLGMPLEGGGAYYTTSNISITPTVSPTELLTNGSFAAWTVPDTPDGWTVVGEVGADPEVSEVGAAEGHGGAGTGACNLYSSATASAPVIRQTPLTAFTWYDVTIPITKRVAGAISSNYSAVGLSKTLNTEGTHQLTGRCLSGTLWGLIPGAAPTDITVDGLSVKALTTMDQLFTHTLAYGNFSITFTIADASYQAGVTFNYTDDNNFARVYYDRLDGKVYFTTRIAGVNAQVNAYPAAYSAGKTLKVTRYGNGTLDITYNNVALATGLTATGLTGLQAGPFLTNAAGVSISNYTWDARGF